MPWINQNMNSPSPIERLVGGLCYLTFGLAGILYIVISGKRSQSSFFRFHFLQAMVVSIVGVLLNFTMAALTTVLGSMAPMLGPQLGAEALSWLGFAIGIILRAAWLLLIYGMIWCFLGKYAEIPFISNIVRRQM